MHIEMYIKKQKVPKPKPKQTFYKNKIYNYTVVFESVVFQVIVLCGYWIIILKE
jgi:hypothetical protein